MTGADICLILAMAHFSFPPPVIAFEVLKAKGPGIAYDAGAFLARKADGRYFISRDGNSWSLVVTANHPDLTCSPRSSSTH